MSSGRNEKNNPRSDGDVRDTTPVDPVEMEEQAAGLDAGWDDLGLDDLLGPDEGPTVVDGSLEMAAAEVAMDEPSREPARTFLGMGPEAQVAPTSEEEIPDEEVTEVNVQPLPEVNDPGTLDGLASRAEPEPKQVQSPLATDTGAPTLAPEPVVPADDAPPPRRPTPPPADVEEPRVTRERLAGKPGAPARRRVAAETEPTIPVVRRRTGQGEDGEVALAATMAPGELDAMAIAPTMAPDPDSAILRMPPPPPPPAAAEADPAAPGTPEPPAPTPRPAPTSEPEAPAPKPSEEPTQSVKPAAKPKASAGGAPSNLMLTVLWVLALLSVMVAVALYLFRP